MWTKKKKKKRNETIVTLKLKIIRTTDIQWLVLLVVGLVRLTTQDTCFFENEMLSGMIYNFVCMHVTTKIYLNFTFIFPYSVKTFHYVRFLFFFYLYIVRCLTWNFSLVHKEYKKKERKKTKPSIHKISCFMDLDIYMFSAVCCCCSCSR